MTQAWAYVEWFLGGSSWLRGARWHRATTPCIEVREWNGLKHDEGTLHAKFTVIDGRTAIVGSFNLDPRSARLNSETAEALDDPEFVSSLNEMFEDTYVTRSVAVTWAQAQEYHRPEDIPAAFKLLFSLPLKDWL